MSNPLTQYYRVPKLYVKLPSQGRFYPKGMVETTGNGEVPVYPMSALDQITIRTPDALLNGDAMIRVVSHCVPDIKNPKDLVEPDINTLFVAIRVATHGEQMEIATACPSCNHDNNYQVNLSGLLETQELFDQDNHVEFDGTLLIHLRPYNFEQRNLTLLNEITESQAIGQIQNNLNLDDTTKLTSLGKHMTKMAERTFEIVAKSITQITIIKTGVVVEDRAFIEEWLKHIPKSQADVLTQKIAQLNKVGIDPNHTFVCESCNHEWQQPIDFDPTSFFG